MATLFVPLFLLLTAAVGTRALWDTTLGARCPKIATACRLTARHGSVEIAAAVSTAPALRLSLDDVVHLEDLGVARLNTKLGQDGHEPRAEGV